MQPYYRAPLFAYRLLLHDRTRTIASIGGVAFALVLMMMQVGFRNSLMDSGLQLIRVLDADIVVMSANKYPFLRYQRMPKQRIYQALSIEGVSSAKPVWMDLMRWTNTEGMQGSKRRSSRTKANAGVTARRQSPRCDKWAGSSEKG